MIKAADLSALRAAVADLSWRFAKTMPDEPHWYVTRTPEIEATYAALFYAVKEHGSFADYTSPTGRTYRQQYLRLGDGFKYWVMSPTLDRSRIINRAEDEPLPEAA